MIQDAGSQQESPLVIWQMGKNILGQIIGNKAMSATDDQLIRHGEAARAGERHQLETSDPAFHLRLQCHDLIARVIEPHQ